MSHESDPDADVSAADVSAPGPASGPAAGDDSPGGTSVPPEAPGAAPGKRLSPEAIRALEEAEARRQAAPRMDLPPEINGRREGGEPTRYGDWEKKGLAIDF